MSEFYKTVYQIESFDSSPKVREAFAVPTPPGQEGEWVARKDKDGSRQLIIFERKIASGWGTWFDSIEDAVAYNITVLNDRYKVKIAEIQALLPSGETS